jgi:3-oxoacid CoA-transferase subunit A/glutaconate CoA-transferase subunit A
MPYLYFFDERHIAEWLRLSRSAEGTGRYMDRYVRGVADFDEYLDRVGGLHRMQELQRIEAGQEEEAAQ